MITHSIAHRDSLETMGYNGEGRIQFNITGYKREFLEVKVSRRSHWNDKTPVEWNIDYDIPRYGRDHDQVATNSRVVKNIRAALADAIIEMEHLEDNIEVLEAHFQRGEKDREAEKARKAAERQAKIDADKAVGYKLAKTICDEMVKQARETQNDSQEVVFKTRGDHHEYKMRCVYTYTGLTLFNMGWNRVARKDAVAKLADAWLNSVDTGDIKDSIPDARLAGFMMGGKN